MIIAFTQRFLTQKRTVPFFSGVRTSDDFLPLIFLLPGFSVSHFYWSAFFSLLHYSLAAHDWAWIGWMCSFIASFRCFATVSYPTFQSTLLSCFFYIIKNVFLVFRNRYWHWLTFDTPFSYSRPVVVLPGSVSPTLSYGFHLASGTTIRFPKQ